MDDACELGKFDDVGEKEDEDLAGAVAPPTTNLKRGDLPKKHVLETLLLKAVEAGTKAAADKGERDMVTQCLSVDQMCTDLGLQRTAMKRLGAK